MIPSHHRREWDRHAGTVTQRSRNRWTDFSFRPRNLTRGLSKVSLDNSLFLGIHYMYFLPSNIRTGICLIFPIVFDASGHIQSGYLLGNTNALGNFLQCRDITADQPSLRNEQRPLEPFKWALTNTRKLFFFLQNQLFFRGRYIHLSVYDYSEKSEDKMNLRPPNPSEKGAFVSRQRSGENDIRVGM